MVSFFLDNDPVNLKKSDFELEASSGDDTISKGNFETINDDKADSYLHLEKSSGRQENEKHKDNTMLEEMFNSEDASNNNEVAGENDANRNEIYSYDFNNADELKKSSGKQENEEHNDITMPEEMFNSKDAANGNKVAGENDANRNEIDSYDFNNADKGFENDGKEDEPNHLKKSSGRQENDEEHKDNTMPEEMFNSKDAANGNEDASGIDADLNEIDSYGFNNADELKKSSGRQENEEHNDNTMSEEMFDSEDASNGNEVAGENDANCNEIYSYDFNNADEIKESSGNQENEEPKGKTLSEEMFNSKDSVNGNEVASENDANRNEIDSYDFKNADEIKESSGNQENEEPKDKTLSEEMFNSKDAVNGNEVAGKNDANRNEIDSYDFNNVDKGFENDGKEDEPNHLKKSSGKQENEESKDKTLSEEMFNSKDAANGNEVAGENDANPNEMLETRNLGKVDQNDRPAGSQVDDKRIGNWIRNDGTLLSKGHHPKFSGIASESSIYSDGKKEMHLENVEGGVAKSLQLEFERDSVE